MLIRDYGLGLGRLFSLAGYLWTEPMSRRIKLYSRVNTKCNE